MRLYLCRHAEALAGHPDTLRELTARGRDRARELGATLAGFDPPPQIVLSSPLKRARQTADAIAEVTGAQVIVDQRLAPGATPASLLTAVAETGSESVAAVGHQPDCSQIALQLAADDPGFPPAGMLALDLDGI